MFKYTIYTKESVYQACVILKKNSLKMNCTLSIRQLAQEHSILYTLWSIWAYPSLFLLKVTMILIFIFIFCFFSDRFTCMYVLLNMPYKIIFIQCIFSLTCCFCLLFLSLVWVGAFNWNTSYFLLYVFLWYVYTLIYLPILNLVCICVVSSSLCNKVALSTLVLSVIRLHWVLLYMSPGACVHKLL